MNEMRDPLVNQKPRMIVDIDDEQIDDEQADLYPDLPDPPFTVRDQAHLEELLLEGMNSGPGIVITPEYWENKLKMLLERHHQRTQESTQ